MRRTLSLLALLLTPCLPLAGQAADGVSVSELLVRVGESVHRFYLEAQSVMCIESVSQQQIRSDLMADINTFPRRLIYELHLEWDAAEGTVPSEARIRRELVRVNNRVPRPRDKPKCLDPRSTSHESLEMLLPSNQVDYTFSLAGRARIDSRQALLIDFKDTRTGPVVVTAHEDRDECWSVEIPGRTRGRIWIDAETFDVLRIDERLTGPVDVRQSIRDKKKRRSDIETTFERLDSTVVYRPVQFHQPEASLMLPVSAEHVQVSTGPNGARMRTSTRFTDYQRFMTEGRIVEQ